MTAEQVAALGLGLAARMSVAQLHAATLLHGSIQRATTTENVIPMSVVKRAFMNHMQKCIRMPAGGALAGGSQQTGFEMELVSSACVSELCAGWPNHETAESGCRQSWELRTMEELSEHLALHKPPAGWGAMQGKAMALAPGRMAHTGVLLCGPPLTLTWLQHPDLTTILRVRFPILLWTETDAMILPPDDLEGVPFYVDPTNQPGFHRDLFKTWGRRVAGELLTQGMPMSGAVQSHLSAEYLSDGDLSSHGDSLPST